jgi:hypothetical protein
MKVSEKKRPNQRTKKPRAKDPRSKDQGKQAKAKSKQGNEAKPTKKGLKRRPNSNNNPNSRHTTNPSGSCLGRSLVIPNVRKARA